MKKNDWIFLASLTAYTCLLWEQEPGLNFLIMTSILLCGIIIRDKSVLRDKVWLLTATGAFVSSFCVAWYGNALSIIANFVALLLTGVFRFHKGNSFFAAFALGMANTAASFGFIIVAFIRRVNKAGEESGRSRQRVKRIILMGAVLVVAFIFFLLYRQSSLLFEAFTDKIDLSFISFQWCVFVLFGAVLVYAFYHHLPFAPVAEWERNLPMNLHPKERNSFFDTIMGADSEYFAGLVLLGVLNALLLMVNALDLTFLLGGESALPQGVTYSQYVHQGITMLILSIIFATIIILFWFRNFHGTTKSAQRLRQLAFLWIAQNMLMVVVSIYRNHSYIFVYGLTYKRIGVDVWLLLAVAGLSLVMWKIYRQKTNAYVVKYFGWICFGMLVVSAPVNWDKLIFNYNSSLNRPLDMHYMNSLSWTILPDQHDHLRAGRSMVPVVPAELDKKTFGFMSWHRHLQEERKIPSWLLGDHGVYKDLIARDTLASGQLHAPNVDLHTIYFFNGYRHTQWMDVSSNHLESLGEVALYTELITLDLQNNPQLTSLYGIQQCTNLRALDLRATGISNLYPLIHLPQLEVLYVDRATEQTRHLQLINPKLQIKGYGYYNNDGQYITD